MVVGWSSCAGLCPGRRGWAAGGGPFCAPKGGLLFPTVPSRAGAGWGGAGVGESPLHLPALEQMALQPARPPPPRLPGPLFPCKVLTIVRGPSLNKSHVTLAQRTLPTAPCQPQDSHAPCPAPTPCCGTPPFPAPHTGSFWLPGPSTNIRWPIWLMLQALESSSIWRLFGGKSSSGSGGRKA